MAAKVCSGAVNAHAFHTHFSGKSLRHIKTHAQNPSIWHPEICLRVNRNRGGESAATQAIAGAVAQPIVLTRGKSFLHGGGNCRKPTAFVKLAKPELSLHGDVAQADARAAQPSGQLVVTEGRNYADG